MRPRGPGLRGLITGNVVRARPRAARRGRAGDDQRAGRNPLHDASAGRARCGGATAATRSSSAPTRPTSRRSRSRTCARTSAARAAARAQAAGYRSRTFNVTGATRIVQRVICVGGERREVVLGARLELHPHLQGRGRDRRRARADGRDPRRHAARARRVGERDPAAQLRRQRQRRRADGRRARRRADAAARSSVRARSPTPERQLRRPRSLPERARADQRRHERASRRARSRSSCRPRTPPATSATPPR